MYGMGEDEASVKKKEPYRNLTLSDLNLLKEKNKKKKKLKSMIKQVKSKSIYRSCQYRKQLNSSAKIQTMI